MKKLVIALLLASGFTACKKEEDKPTTTTPEGYKCASCVAKPEANPAYDGSSAGVYKAVLVGSSGTVAMYLYNTGTEVKALVTFDGKNATLTTTSLSAWTPGMAITGAIFTGVVDGKNVQVLFSVGANGLNPNMVVSITGHTVVVAVYKETSATLVKNYEGTYTGSNSGTFNMAFHGNDYSIVTTGGNAPMVGTLVNGKIDMVANDVEVKGSFNNDDVTGTWKNSKEGTSGTWTGKRTL